MKDINVTAPRNITGIKSLGFFTASPVHTCDRCGQGIKYVAAVTYKDDTRMEFGMDCIEKILSGDNTLLKLWKKNHRLVKHFQACLEILSLPEDQLPLGKRAINDSTGAFRFIADEKGQWMTVKTYPQGSAHMLFIPTPVNIEAAKFTGERKFDMRNLPGKSCWEPWTLENWQAKCRFEIELAKTWLKSEIERINAFLARILAKGLVTTQEVK